MTPPADRRPGSGGQNRGQGGTLPMAQVARFSLAGPLGRVLEAGVSQEVDSDGPDNRDKTRPPRRDATVYRVRGPALNDEANALLVLRRLAVHRTLDSDPTVPAEPEEPFLTWARQHRLGYRDDWAAAVARRRARALSLLTAQGLHVRRVVLRTEWRMVVGLGEVMGEHEFGLSLHGTWGWPHIPGSTLKGVAAAWARLRDEPAELRAAVFGGVAGTPARPDGEPEDEDTGAKAGTDPEAARTTPGTVRFLDAPPEPHSAPKNRLQVHSDVITPHQREYHTQDPPAAPGEHHAPVPVPFLSLSGTFVADLVGDDPDTTGRAADWLAAACDDIGLGARTTAGYGYLTATTNTEWTPS